MRKTRVAGAVTAGLIGLGVASVPAGAASPVVNPSLAGYVSLGRPTQIQGMLRVPIMRCRTANTYAGSWIGLQNFHLAQEGIQWGCDGARHEYAEAFIEDYPGPPVFESFPVRNNDRVYLVESELRPGVYSYGFHDLTNGHVAHYTVNFPGWTPNEALWITEKVSRVTVPANHGIYWSGCTTNGRPVSASQVKAETSFSNDYPRGPGGFVTLMSGA